MNAFWKDYAAFGGEGEFLSGNFAQACGSFAEMMLALSVLDLPFEAGKHESAAKDASITIKAASPMIVFHKEISEAPQADARTPILVSQNYFRADDRYTFVDNERTDKYVAEEFLTFVVYGCQVVVTNPTSAPQKLDVLLQLPRGAMPVSNAQLTRGLHIDLPPYNTRTVEYFFYFPRTGEFPHFPVHVAKNEKLIALCPPATLKAVAQPSKLDTASWDYISQFGSDDDVVNYMQANNLGRINLDRVAWRMAGKEYFQKVLAILSARHVYNHTLWSYSLKHNDLPALREYLQHCDDFVAQCGSYLESRPLTIDPVLRTSYQQMEYAPLVNARAHKLGKGRQIVNERFFGQYMRLMDILSHKQALDNDDRMAVVYYLLLQDRIEEAKAQFDAVDPAKLATAIQYDYFAAYLGFFGEDVKPVRALAEKYKDYPVDRWRNLFAAVTAQLDELEGKGAKVVDAEDKAQQQAKLAAT
ncbi:MAG: hypothetical protein HZA50_16260 [Planctomycetes bacterium]|nr:hypothetical protein [Planctomycetota bacterium]